MSKLIPTTQRNGACEVCGDESGKCRRLHQGDIHLCMTFADARFGEVQNGLKCIKPDRGKGWATFKIDTTQEWTDQQRQEWQAKAALRHQQYAAAEADRKERSLDPDERDRHYRALLDELTLHSEDYKDLIRRGFTTAEIEQIGFKSIERYQSLQQQYPELLPGVGAGGQQLVNFDAGYLCPLRDRQGRIVAFQVRLRALGSDDRKRYNWLSSSEKRKHVLHFYPDDKQTGELPLTICRPQGKPIGIALAEGTGAKPHLVARRHQFVTIGAAGGQWAASPQTLKQTLDAEAALLEGDRLVRLFVDGGDLLNRAVMNRWRKLAKLLSEWGYVPRFAWWGQIDKADSDIDELQPEQFSEIQLLTPRQFWRLEAQHRHRQPAIEKLKRLQDELDDQHYDRLTRLSCTPWKEVNQPLLDLQALNLEPGVIYIIVSAKATGKTQGLKPLMPQFDNCYAWFARIALGRAECATLDLQWKDELGSFNGRLKTGFCSNSAYQFHPRLLQHKGLLLVDECDQVFDHNFSRTCNRDGMRPAILNILQHQMHAAIAGGGMCLFMSADVTDRDVEYIQQLAPADTPVRVIVNHYQPPLGTIHFDHSKTPDALIEQLIARLEAGQPCFVIDDIREGVRGCKSIAQLIKRLHPEWESRIVEINAETSGTAEMIDFITHINERSRTALLIVCSPTVVSGLSIQNLRFTNNVYGFFNGILTCSQASQALGRNRGLQNAQVWVAERGMRLEANGATDPEEIKAWYQRNYAANCRHLLSFASGYSVLTSEWGSPHFNLYCKNVAYRNLCSKRLRERMRACFAKEGYTIVDTHLGESEAVQAGLKRECHDLQLAKARQVAQASLLDDSSYLRLLNSRDALSQAEQHSLEKTQLLKQFGQAIIDQITYLHKPTGELLSGYEALYLKNGRGQYYRALESFYLLQADPAEAVAKDLAPEQRQLLNSGERFAGDIRWRSREKKAREYFKLPEFLIPDRWFTPLEINPFGQRMQAMAGEVKDVLNLTVNTMYPGQIFGQMMAQIGLELEERACTAADGKRYRERRITTESWSCAQLFVQHQQQMRQAVQPEPEPALAEVSIAQESVVHEGEVQISTSPDITRQPVENDHPLGPIFNEGDPGGDLTTSAGLSTEELAGFAAYLAEATEYGIETVEEVWSQWGETIKQQVLQTLRVKIPNLFGRLETMLGQSGWRSLFAGLGP